MFEVARTILPHAIRADASLDRLRSRLDEAITTVKTGQPSLCNPVA